MAIIHKRIAKAIIKRHDCWAVDYIDNKAKIELGDCFAAKQNNSLFNNYIKILNKLYQSAMGEEGFNLLKNKNRLWEENENLSDQLNICSSKQHSNRYISCSDPRYRELYIKFKNKKEEAIEAEKNFYCYIEEYRHRLLIFNYCRMYFLDSNKLKASLPIDEILIFHRSLLLKECAIKIGHRKKGLEHFESIAKKLDHNTLEEYKTHLVNEITNKKINKEFNNPQNMPILPSLTQKKVVEECIKEFGVERVRNYNSTITIDVNNEEKFVNFKLLNKLRH